MLLGLDIATLERWLSERAKVEERSKDDADITPSRYRPSYAMVECNPEYFDNVDDNHHVKNG